MSEEWQKKIEILMGQWNKNYNHEEIEKKWQSKWLEKEFYEKIFSFNVNNKPIFSIDTPPPFTSGELHMGHARWVSIVDSIARYKRMTGYSVLLPQGWDSLGLPTELKVQNIWKIPKSNKDLFIAKCKEWTDLMISKMKNSMIRLGYRPNWEKYEYITYKEDYRKAIQKSLIEMYKMGYIYLKEGPVYWCPKCETAVAQSEVGYIEDKEGIIAEIRFPLSDGEIIIATTRPELLPAIQAIAVNPNDERYKKLIGKSAKVPLYGNEVKIIEDESVDPSFGTGATMICTYGDFQDVKWQLKHRLPVKQVINEQGKMVNTKYLDGLSIKEARTKIIKLLKEQNYLINVSQFSHNVVAHTERSDCNTPIEFLVKKQIYLKTLEFKQKLFEIINEMDWYPIRAKRLLEDWINSIEWDWTISRQRIWGTPLPFLICKNCERLYPVDEDLLPINDPSEMKRKKRYCESCNSELEPVSDVADVWVDSSITALYISGYFSGSENFEKVYPISLREQGYEIIRTWLFYTIYRSLALTGKIPFKSVLVNGWVLGPDGTRMSKSKGNVIDPLEMAKKYGADSVRMALLSSSVYEDFPVNENVIKAMRLTLQKLWNLCRLIYPFIKLDNMQENPGDSSRFIDKWIISELENLKSRVINYMEKYELGKALDEIKAFIWELLADEYAEMIKYRLFKRDQTATSTMGKVLLEISKLLHPFAPHITEEIYSKMFGYKISIELEEIKKGTPPLDLETTQSLRSFILKANSIIRSKKRENKIPMSSKAIARIQIPAKLSHLYKELKEDIINTHKLEIKEEKVGGEELVINISPWE